MLTEGMGEGQVKDELKGKGEKGKILTLPNLT